MCPYFMSVLLGEVLLTVHFEKRNCLNSHIIEIAVFFSGREYVV